MINRVRAFTVAAALATLPALASAQDKQFEVGTKLLNVGVLVGSESYGSLGVGGGVEVGFKDIEGKVVLGVGGSIGIARSTYDGILNNSGYSSTSVPVLGFVHGHYQIPTVPKLDLYAGPALGVSLFRLNFDAGYCNATTICDDNSADVAAGIQAGARWALTPKVLGWAQVSGGTRMPFLNAGVSFKF
ncbi:MAG: outer membrane beta-barrel protein [Gemmatimonadaceae bacterium]